MRLLDLFTSQVVELPDLVKCDGDTAERMLNARFNKVKSRLQPCIAPNSQRCSDTKEEPMLDIWTFCPFFLSGGRMCEKNIKLLAAPSRSWRTQTYFRERETSRQSSARLRRQTTGAALWFHMNKLGSL